MLTPEQRTLRAKLAAEARWSNEDPTANGVRASKGLRAKFVREVREKFPDLPEDQIQKRAEHAFRAHMYRLALKSSKARAAKRYG